MSSSHLLLAFPQVFVSEDGRHELLCCLDGTRGFPARTYSCSAEIPKSLGDLLEDLGAWFAETSLYLREVRVRDAPAKPSELAQRDLTCWRCSG